MKNFGLTPRAALFCSCWALLMCSGKSSAASENINSTACAREPAVAGLFYPADPKELAASVDRLLATAANVHLAQIKAIIVPHAGYAYSGPVAAKAYRQLRGTHFETVIVMGPAHFASLIKASISGASAYRTPLGDVPTATKTIADLVKMAPFQIDARATVEAPEWVNRVKTLKSGETENADTWEHSVEVELPFLQRTLGKFSLVPVIFGEVDTERAAKSLSRILDDTTLMVASSDLSHYHPYAEARQLDQKFVDAVMRLDLTAAENGEACGKNPILTLMRIAKERGWQPRLLDLRNSGDTSGDKSRVVGYAAIVFVGNNTQARASPPLLNIEDRAFLLTLARQSIDQTINHHQITAPVEQSVSRELREKRACFVTITENGNLRGCIGTLQAERPLYQMIASAASSAAVEDPRFPPVTPSEIKRLRLEISVLTQPQPLPFSSSDDLLRRLRPHQDGVVLHIGEKQATYLPQVWDDISDKTEFMNTLAEKAGAHPDDWRGKNVIVEVYQVEAFEELKDLRPQQ